MARFAEVLIYVFVLSCLVLIGIIFIKTSSFNEGVSDMSKKIETSLTTAGLEGVSRVLGKDVYKCVGEVKYSSGRLLELGYFDLDGRRALGAQLYQECYLQGLKDISLINQSDAIEKAVSVIQAQ